MPVSELVDDRSGQPDDKTQANKTPKTNKKEITIERGNPLCSDDLEIPELLQELRENLVDNEIRLQGGSHASSSHEASLEPRREDLGEHNVHTHFPKDRNCEICKRTKITRDPCRRRKGEAVPRADNFGDLITADHKVVSDNCESRNNHRYAVVVQDLASQWIQSYPCKKKKTSQETQRSLQKFLDPERKPKVIYTDNSLEFGKACEDLSWKHCTSTPHRSETNGIAERAVRRAKEGTSVVLLQSGLNESWWEDAMECYTCLRNVTDILTDGKTPYERRFGQPLKGPIIPFGSLFRDKIQVQDPPSRAMIEAHNLTLLPAAPWCEICVQARGESDWHSVQMDFQFISGVAVWCPEAQAKATVLTMVDMDSGFVGVLISRSPSSFVDKFEGGENEIEI